VSIPIVFATIPATRGSAASAAHDEPGRNIIPPPAVMATVERNRRLEQFV
jgi:hypothetical protein